MSLYLLFYFFILFHFSFSNFLFLIYIFYFFAFLFYFTFFPKIELHFSIFSFYFYFYHFSFSLFYFYLKENNILFHLPFFVFINFLLLKIVCWLLSQNLHLILSCSKLFFNHLFVFLFLSICYYSFLVFYFSFSF